MVCSGIGYLPQECPDAHEGLLVWLMIYATLVNTHIHTDKTDRQILTSYTISGISSYSGQRLCTVVSVAVGACVQTAQVLKV